MPLSHGKSKKAFVSNLKSEMAAGKPKKSALAIAYSVQRHAKKKKMAEGGEINFRDEKRSDIDNQRDSRSEEMLNKARSMHEQELDARKESLLSDSIDGSKDEMEEEMLEDRPSKHADEIRAASGKPTEDEQDEMELDMMKKRMYEGGEVDADTHSMGEDMLKDEDEDESMMLSMDPKDIVDAMRAKTRMMAEGGEVDLQDDENEHLNEEDDLSYKAARKNTYFDISQLKKQPEDSNEHGHNLDDEDEYDMVDSIRSKMNKKKRQM